MKNEKIVSRPQDAVKIAETMILDKWKEHIFCLALSPRQKLRKKELISLGTLDASLAHPREIFRKAIVSRAAGVIVLHNHPSGDSSPSEADIELTKRLKHAGQIIGIELLDHVIFAPGGDFYSFRDKGGLN